VSTGGPANADYVVLTSTNLATPLSQWTPVLTNHFDDHGDFGFTNALNLNWPQSFYLLRTP
jgi:hypothetical protein